MEIKRQKWFRRELIERFMDKEELERFESAYQESRIVNIGRHSLKKEKLLF
jgi:hypothetical protein